MDYLLRICFVWIPQTDGRTFKFLFHRGPSRWLLGVMLPRLSSAFWQLVIWTERKSVVFRDFFLFSNQTNRSPANHFVCRSIRSFALKKSAASFPSLGSARRFSSLRSRRTNCTDLLVAKQTQSLSLHADRQQQHSSKCRGYTARKQPKKWVSGSSDRLHQETKEKDGKKSQARWCRLKFASYSSSISWLQQPTRWWA